MQMKVFKEYMWKLTQPAIRRDPTASLRQQRLSFLLIITVYQNVNKPVNFSGSHDGLLSEGYDLVGIDDVTSISDSLGSLPVVEGGMSVGFQ